MDKIICTNGHVIESGRDFCQRCNSPARVEEFATSNRPFQEEQATVPTEMITEEMREAGVDETTPLVTREDVVEEIGEEAVAKLEEQVTAKTPAKKKVAAKKKTSKAK